MLETLLWEMDGVPGVGTDAQDVLNQQFDDFESQPTNPVRSS